MKTRDWLAILGAFCLAFGGKIKDRIDSTAAWWVGDALLTIGPILMAARAFGERKAKEPEPDSP
jgi:integral membrane sensor domain MASE1